MIEKTMFFNVGKRTMILILLIMFTVGCQNQEVSTSEGITPTRIDFQTIASDMDTPTVVLDQPDEWSNSDHEQITVDNVEELEVISILEGHLDNVYTVVVSADNSLMASISPDKTIRIWDVEGEEEIHSFEIGEVIMNEIDFSPDGRLLASSEKIWRYDDMEVEHILGVGKLGTIAFSPDGSQLAVAWVDEPIRIWDTSSGLVVNEFSERVNNIIHSIDFSPDGRLLATGGSLNGLVSIWNVESGEVVREFFHDDRSNLHGLDFSPDGQLLVSAATEGTAKLWDIESGELVYTVPMNSCYDATFSPDGGILATSGCGNTVTLWDVDNWQLIKTLEHGGNVMTAAFSMDGTLLISGGYDNKIYVWGIPAY